MCVRPPSYRLEIDANAETDLTKFSGDVDILGYLKHDLQNAAFLRLQGDVMAVGAGGGRDVLSALVYGAKKFGQWRSTRTYPVRLTEVW